MSDLISIIIPIYNTDKYLARCLDSVVSQTYTNLEIILINDGSTDNSLSICEQYRLDDNRIRLINQQNTGQAIARNIALDIAFVDSDDWVTVDYIEALYTNIIKYSADISISTSIVCTKQIQVQINSNSENVYVNNNSLMQAFLSNKISSMACGSLIQAQVLDNQRFRDFIAYEDLDFFYKIYSKADVVVKDDNVRYFYYQRNDGTMGINRLHFSLEHLDALKIISADYENFLIQKYPEYGNLVYMSILKRIIDNFAEAFIRRNYIAKDIHIVYKNLYRNAINQNYKIALPYKIFFYFPGFIAVCYLVAKKIKLSVKRKMSIK